MASAARANYSRPRNEEIKNRTPDPQGLHLRPHDRETRLQQGRVPRSRTRKLKKGDETQMCENLDRTKATPGWAYYRKENLPAGFRRWYFGQAMPCRCGDKLFFEADDHRLTPVEVVIDPEGEHECHDTSAPTKSRTEPDASARPGTRKPSSAASSAAAPFLKFTASRTGRLAERAEQIKNREKGERENDTNAMGLESGKKETDSSHR